MFKSPLNLKQDSNINQRFHIEKFISSIIDTIQAELMNL